MAKTFKTYDDLIEFLKINKKLVISDEEKAKHILSKTGYFSLISGYKDIFNNTETKKYDGSTSFDDIYSLYRFSETYGELQKEYLTTANYDFGNKNNQNGIHKLLSIFLGHLTGKSDYFKIFIGQRGFRRFFTMI